MLLQRCLAALDGEARQTGNVERRACFEANLVGALGNKTISLGFGKESFFREPCQLKQKNHD